MYIPSTTSVTVRFIFICLYCAQHTYFPSSDFSTCRILKYLKFFTLYFSDFHILTPFLVHQYVVPSAFLSTRHSNFASLSINAVKFSGNFLNFGSPGAIILKFKYKIIFLEISQNVYIEQNNHDLTFWCSSIGSDKT